jgi:hypothetical protein
MTGQFALIKKDTIYVEGAALYNDLVNYRRVDLTDITDITVWSTSQKVYFAQCPFWYVLSRFREGSLSDPPAIIGV